MLLAALLCIAFWFPSGFGVQSLIELSPSGLDSLLQDYAFRAFGKRAKTGIVYDGIVPSNLTGIKVAALRLRSGSMRRRGVKSFKEFEIPIGLIEQPYVERLVLVYHNLGNWSELYYPLPGYTYLSPVLGMLAYNAYNLSAKDLPELDLRASKEPMRINFSFSQTTNQEASPKCVHFDLDGSPEFDNVVDKNACFATKQGHFSIVVEVGGAAPAPAPRNGAPGNGGNHGRGDGDGKNRKKVYAIVGSVVGGMVCLVVLLGCLFICLKRCRDRKKRGKMEATADLDVPLRMAIVGNTKAPVASEIRTRPMLEDDYLI
ncbi:hypothetical protein LIER_33363 [Lithospermum erythrorhizon]|uniref:Uncharacterized protein n=1 Tax=Lithospermum erythrorhizon TaxID=34254 RepID=A0AAV3RZP8_LITER